MLIESFFSMNIVTANILNIRMGKKKTETDEDLLGNAKGYGK